jgi:hypothetical protein
MTPSVVTGTAAAAPFEFYGPAALTKQSQLAKLFWLLHLKALSGSSKLTGIAASFFTTRLTSTPALACHHGAKLANAVATAQSGSDVLTRA